MKKLSIKLFKCKKCNGHFSSSHSLNNHMHSHTRKLGRKLRTPLSWFSSSDEDEVKSLDANNKGKGLADPDPGSSNHEPLPDPNPTPTPTPAVTLKVTPPLEECVAAWSLVFLSRDSWARHAPAAGDDHSGEGMSSVARKARVEQVCSTCGKAFWSPRALAGHQACHAKGNFESMGA